MADVLLRGTSGVMVVGVRTDTPAGLATGDGNQECLHFDSSGRLQVTGTSVISDMTPGTDPTDLGKAEDQAHVSGDVGVMFLAVRTDTPANRSGTDCDYEPPQMSAGRMWCSTTVTAISAGSAIIGGTYDAGPSWTSSFGVSSAAFTSADATSVVAVTDAPTSGQKLVVTDILVSSDTAMNLSFKCETTGVLIAKVFVPANGTVQYTPRGKIKLASADKKLTVTASVAGNIAVTASYYSEA